MNSKFSDEQSTGPESSGPVPPSSGPIPGSAPPPPPPPPPPPVARQLVRDPYSRLGGVSSGISHHYGIDVSLVRIAFVVFTLASGFGILVYLLSWLIIPRATYWPPVAAPKPIRVLTSREIAIGLLVLGLLVAVFFTGGGLSKILVPLVLIAGGVRLLLQSDIEQTELNERQSFGQSGGPVDTVRVDSISDDETSRYASPPTGSVPGSMPPGTPVSRTKRRWRRRLLLAPLLLLLAIPISIVAVVAFADIDINFADVQLKPESVEALPDSISEEQANLVVDLTELGPEMFEDGPHPLDIRVEFGDVEVIVPDDLAVEVQAEVNIGSLQVFDNSEDGLGSEITVGNDDPDLVLDVRVDIGNLVVQRAGSGG